jgi:menaquinone-specific isochorismate synthase
MALYHSPVVMTTSLPTLTRPRIAYLSLAGSESSLQEWVDSSIAEGVSNARQSGHTIIHVSKRSVDLPLPLAAFDSHSVDDIQLVAGKDWSFFGMGIAKVVEHGAPLDLGDAKVMVVGGSGIPGMMGRGVWRDFRSSMWVIPSLALSTEEGRTTLTVTAEISPATKPSLLRTTFHRLLNELTPAERDQRLPKLVSAKSTPERRRWESISNKALGAISRGDMKKIVLSRKVRLSFSDRIPVGQVLVRLFSANPDATIFAFRRKTSVFLGATPESLLSAKRGDIEVECLAATLPRGGDEMGDENLGRRLLSDRKSIHEHAVVVEAAVSALSPLSSRVEVPSGPVLKKLTSIQHLQTTVRASLRPGENVWSAARALWPNPAIAGEPREKAVRWLQRFEGVDRGWYSGVVGAASARGDEGRLFIGIRAGLVRKHVAVLYAGAGLVPGSEPEAEFDETGWKLRVMGRALGVDDDSLR